VFLQEASAGAAESLQAGELGGGDVAGAAVEGVEDFLQPKQVREPELIGKRDGNGPVGLTCQAGVA
jgi:hypothetical protein